MAKLFFFLVSVNIHPEDKRIASSLGTFQADVWEFSSLQFPGHFKHFFLMYKNVCSLKAVARFQRATQTYHKQCCKSHS